MKYVALICARGGSKGIPGKNIKLLSGVPLVGWAIKAAKKVKRIEQILVSTDSDEIAKIARDFGAEVPFLRPGELAKDESPEWLVWQHALNYFVNQPLKIDGLLVIPPTAPLRNEQDLNNCIVEFEKGDVDVVITVTDAHRNPYFNMIKKDQDGLCSLVIQPEKNVWRRQDVPEVFDVTTVAYVARPQFVLESESLLDGRVRSVYIPPERSLDIDTPFDLKIAECLIAGK